MVDEQWGPCTSREEWLLMYERGISPERIAALCRVRPWIVRRVADRKDQKDPEFFHRRPVVHDQPALPKARPLLTWSEGYANLVWFIENTGRHPRQHGATSERICHGFLYKVRRHYDAGLLTPEQVELLERIDGWYAPPRGPNHWETRLAAYRAFLQEHGRRPRVAAAKGSEERSLGIWMASQRENLARDNLASNRVEVLDREIPDWDAARPTG